MTPTQSIPLKDALAAALAHVRDRERLGSLTRTGSAHAEIRNPEGRTLRYRIRRKRDWIDRYGNPRSGRGYWIDAHVGFEWRIVGGSTPEGALQPVAGGPSEEYLLLGARLVLIGLRDHQLVVEHRNRIYTLSVEDRCGRCDGPLNAWAECEGCYQSATWRERVPG